MGGAVAALIRHVSRVRAVLQYGITFSMRLKAMRELADLISFF